MPTPNPTKARAPGKASLVKLGKARNLEKVGRLRSSNQAAKLSILFFPVGDSSLASTETQAYQRADDLRALGIRADVLVRKEKKGWEGNKDRYLLFPFAFSQYDVVFFQKTMNIVDYNLAKLCKAFGKKIPIYPGAEKPLVIEQHRKKAPLARNLGRFPHDRDFPRQQATRFLRDMIRSHPGEIVLLTIGPLTNIAQLFEADPAIPGLLKGLVLMGGVFTDRIPGAGPLEWNAMGDPHATAITYRHAVNVHRSIGLDVTCQVCMNAAEVRHHFRTRNLEPLSHFTETFLAHSDCVVFHDPLAAITIFDAEVCAFERGHVEIELDCAHTRGKTRWTAAPGFGRHEVAFGVNVPRFFDRYFSVF